MPTPTELPGSLSEFSFRNAATIDGGRNFDNDIERLIRSMDEIIDRQNTLEVEGNSTDLKRQAGEE
jgi:hypothetical protein